MKIFLQINLSYELIKVIKHVKRNSYLGHFDGQRYQWYDPCHCWLQSSMLISAMNITDTLLPHGVAQVSFQSAQRTEWSFCWTRCSRYHCKDMYYINNQKLITCWATTVSCELNWLYHADFSAQTTRRPQPEDQCRHQPRVHESENQGWNQSEGKQATPCESTMRCVQFSV